LDLAHSVGLSTAAAPHAAMMYEHYFQSDGSKVVSHKPVNLEISTLSAGLKRKFTIAIKTSEDKIKRQSHARDTHARSAAALAVAHSFARFSCFGLIQVA
jgi:hypothetical protein